MKPRSLALMIEDESYECFMSPWDNASTVPVSYPKYAQGVINVWNTLTDTEQRWTNASMNNVRIMHDIIDSNGKCMYDMLDIFSSYAGYILLHRYPKGFGTIEIAVSDRYRRAGHATRMLSAVTRKFLNGDYPDISNIAFVVHNDNKASQAFIEHFSQTAYKYKDVGCDYFDAMMLNHKAYILDI